MTHDELRTQLINANDVASIERVLRDAHATMTRNDTHDDITNTIVFDDECNNDDARDAIHDAHDAITTLHTFTMKQRDDMTRALIASYRDLNVVRTFIDDIAHART